MLWLCVVLVIVAGVGVVDGVVVVVVVVVVVANGGSRGG